MKPLLSYELLLPAEVARAFKVDAKTVTRWAKAGRFPQGAVVRTLGGHRRFSRAVVEAMLRGEKPGGGR